MSDPWSDKWKINEPLKPGGQGKTYIVKSIGGEEQLGVLKELKKQKNMKARKRMYREAAALKTLDCSGVPKLLDSNTDKFSDKSIPLFIVLDYIPGPTFEGFLKDKGALKIDNAIMFTCRLLEIVEQCHEEGIYHRDVKPENIIIRDEKISDPVLIDFGISFNRVDLDKGSLTETEEKFKNKLIALPELVSRDGEKRDGRSDVTYCMAAMIYSLTKLSPTILLNPKGEMPHQRAAEKSILDKIPLYKLEQLRRVFDSCFVYNIDQRLTDPKTVRKALMEVKNLNPTSIGNQTVEDMIAELDKNKQNPEYIESERIEKVVTFVMRCVRAGAGEANGKLGRDFKSKWIDQQYHKDEFIGVQSLRIQSFKDATITCSLQFQIEKVGSEIVMQCLEKGAAKRNVVYRDSIENLENMSKELLQQITNLVRDEYIKRIFPMIK